MPENPLEHRNLDDRQQLLGGRIGERPQARPLAAYEDDGSHPVVVVPADVVVVVLPAVVVVVAFSVVVVAPFVVVVVAPFAVVVVDPGFVVEVIVGRVGVVVVVVETAAAAASSTATVTAWLGAGMLAPLGMNATIIISPLVVKRTERRSPVWVVAAELLCAGGWIFAVSSPVLPASGVPAGHAEPSLYVFCFGSPMELLVRVSPVYCEVNLPSVAFVPASEELFGWIWRTPLPDEYSPRDAWAAAELAGRVWPLLPQRSKTKPAAQWVLVVGWTAAAGWRRS
jgi:hypothetical protein